MKRRLVLFTILALGVFALAELASAKTVHVDVTRVGKVPVPCASEPLGTCHNRWHPAIPPVAHANPGDTIIFETRDALDNQFNRTSTAATVAAANLNRVHPLTGPVFINGAKAGDVLAVTVEKIRPGPDMFGYTVIVPGFGFLRDVFPDPFIVRWELKKKGGAAGFVATSEDMPGVRIPMNENGFPGTIGVALGAAETEVAFKREDALRLAGGFVLPPEPHDAVPDAICGSGKPFADRCLRTIPPRENGGNMDVKQMVAGTTLLFPCFVDGCLLTTGDVHFAQGDGEVSGTAIEMNAIVTVKVEVRRGQAKFVSQPQIEGKEVPNILKRLAPKRFIATTGIPIKAPGKVIPQMFTDGTLAGLSNIAEDVTLAARDALLNMIDLLTGANGAKSPAPKKLGAEQAYILSSVAVDLHISNLVDVPNFLVTAILPLDVFKDERDKGEKENDEKEDED